MPSNKTLTTWAIVLAALSAVYLFLDAHLESFYIFETAHLHDVSKRAIAAHGNDTSSVVDYIVKELSEKIPAAHINLDEEWIFNNAGGAMGAMYIIHASKLLLRIFEIQNLTVISQVSLSISSSLVRLDTPFPI
jgi:C-8 sterol isomerase